MSAPPAEAWVPASDGGVPPRLRRPIAAVAGWWAAVTQDRGWWIGCGVAAAGLAIALGTHPPTAPTLAWHLANGEAIHGLPLPARAPALAGAGHPFDARSWLADLILAWIQPRVGPVGLTGLGAAGAVVLVALVALAARAVAAPARLHPVAMLAGAAAALASMPTTLAGRESLLLPIWTALLLGLLAVARRGSGRGSRARVAARVAIPILLAVWANTQSDVVVGVGAVLVTGAASAVAGRGARRPDRGGLPRWLPVAALAAPLVNPHGPAIALDVPLSLGGLGMHGVLPGWASPDLQTWGRRWAELTAFALLGVTALRPRRAHPADAALAVAAVVLALLFGHDVAVFAVVAGVWLAAQGSALGTAPAVVALAGPVRRPLRVAALAPLLVGLAVAVPTATAMAARGGPRGAVDRRLPVAAASWLARERPPGPWLTTVAVGSYLAGRFPEAGRLLCLGDPVPLAGLGLRRCGELVAIAPGIDGLLRRLRPRLAVLPRDVGLTAFLVTRGWRAADRAGAFVVLRPPPR